MGCITRLIYVRVYGVKSERVRGMGGESRVQHGQMTPPDKNWTAGQRCGGNTSSASWPSR